MLGGACGKSTVDSDVAGEGMSVTQDEVRGGTWAKMAVFASNSSVLGISSKSRIARYVLVDLKKDGNRFEATEKTCDIVSVSSGSSTLTVPEAFIKAVPPNAYAYDLRGKGTELSLTMAKAVEVLGAKLEDRFLSPLPTTASDPQVFDQDGDNNPGVTVEVEGAVLLHLDRPHSS